MHSLKRHLGLMIVVLATIAAADDQTKDLSGASLEELSNIQVYSASKHLQSASEAPASVTVVTFDEIQKFGYRNLADILRSIPMPGMQQVPQNDAVSADWIRVRREFPNSGAFSNVQYSFSTDAHTMIETLVLRLREPKDLMQVSIEDSASAVTTASAMLNSDTPVNRIRLERFGKSSVALARCPAEEGRPATDQTAYEPIFRAATTILMRYRDALGVRKTVPQELTRMGIGTQPKAKQK